MRVTHRGGSSGIPGFELTSMVKRIAIATAALSIAAAFGSAWLGWTMDRLLGLVPASLVYVGFHPPFVPALWQLVTYALVATTPWSVIAAVLGYGWFASDLERTWGSNAFLDRWLLAVLGVAVAQVLAAIAWPELRHEPLIGTELVMESLFVAWGMTFPNRTIRIFFVIPIPGRMLAILTVAFVVLSAVFGGPDQFPIHVAPLASCGLGLGIARGWSARRLYLHYERWRLGRAIQREREQNLH